MTAGRGRVDFPRAAPLIACADDTTVGTETDESNNCRASATTVQVTMP